MYARSGFHDETHVVPIERFRNYATEPMLRK
jgi:hypothetical protein